MGTAKCCKAGSTRARRFRENANLLVARCTRMSNVLQARVSSLPVNGLKSTSSSLRSSTKKPRISSYCSRSVEEHLAANNTTKKKQQKTKKTLDRKLLKNKLAPQLQEQRKGINSKIHSPPLDADHRIQSSKSDNRSTKASRESRILKSKLQSGSKAKEQQRHSFTN